jgi:hypothetical protein
MNIQIALRLQFDCKPIKLRYEIHFSVFVFPKASSRKGIKFHRALFQLHPFFIKVLYGFF